MQNYTLPLERPNKSAFFSLSFFCGTRTPFKSHGAEPYQNDAERHCPIPKTLLHAEQLTGGCPRYHSLRAYIIIPQTQHIPYPPSKNKTIYGITHAKSPTASRCVHPGTRSYIPSPKAKQRQHPIIDAVAVSKFSCFFDRRWRNAHSASDVL